MKAIYSLKSMKCHYSLTVIKKKEISLDKNIKIYFIIRMSYRNKKGLENKMLVLFLHFLHYFSSDVSGQFL